MALLDWDNRYFSVQNWRIKKEISTYCPECFPSLFSSSCLSRVSFVHAKSQWRVQSRASSHAWIHIHCHYRYLAHTSNYKKVNKTLTTLNYIFNGVWKMDLMPGYPLSTLIIVFRSFQSNCSLLTIAVLACSSWWSICDVFCSKGIEPKRNRHFKQQKIINLSQDWCPKSFQRLLSVLGQRRFFPEEACKASTADNKELII